MSGFSDEQVEASARVNAGTYTMPSVVELNARTRFGFIGVVAREIRFDTVSTVQTVGGALLSLEHVVGAA